MNSTDAMHHKEKHSVAVHFLRLLTDYITQHGLNEQAFLAQANINSQELADPNARVAYGKFNHLCQLAAEALQDPCLGLKLGESIRAGHLGSHGFALMSCANGAELMRQHTRYSSLTIDAAHAAFEQRGDEYIRFLRSNLPGGELLGRLQDDLNLATTVTLARWFTNRQDLSPKWVSFRHTKPNEIKEYEALFRCPVHFDADETAIAVDASYLSLPLPHANPQLHRIMDDLCAQLVKQLGEAHEPSWMAAARRAALESFQRGDPQVSEIARAAGCTEAEFKDNLSQRGLSFRSFIDDIRHALALGYARDPSLSLVDIAYLLGFSEQSSFQRAFKRWTGKTPGEFRRTI